MLENSVCVAEDAQTDFAVLSAVIIIGKSVWNVKHKV